VLHLDPYYAEAYYNRHLTYIQRGASGDDRLAKADMEQYRRLTQAMKSMPYDRYHGGHNGGGIK
jgi:hypothetical protein